MGKWIDIYIPKELIGETITKGKDSYAKEYTYIKIPKGYGYDNYCFLLSSRCVYDFYISLNSDMKIDLFYDPEYREDGKKRYKRYLMTGQELYDTVFSKYEGLYLEQEEEQRKSELAEKERKEKQILGKIICGIYTGNKYAVVNPKYTGSILYRAFFIQNNGSSYCNSEFDKVRNVKEKFVIAENVSKFFFFCHEYDLNLLLDSYMDYLILQRQLEKTKKKLNDIQNPQFAEISAAIAKQLETFPRCLEDLKESIQRKVGKVNNE